MVRISLWLNLFIIMLTFGNSRVLAQSGDQILDGIGETGMVARYVLNGDLKDWSRNNLHAKYHGANIQFANDQRFGKVLSLTGEANAYISIPADAFNQLESISISGWINIRSNQIGQHFFDFGKDAAQHFFAAPLGTNTQAGNVAMVTVLNGQSNGVVSAALGINSWVHVAIVADVSSKALVAYVNGKQAGIANGVAFNLSAILGEQAGDKKQFYIGKSLMPGNPNLNALIHDFRIYRIPLSASQVETIYKNASKSLNEGAVNVKKREDDLPRFAASDAQLYNRFLISVQNAQVETEVGNLPRLPSYVTGTYRYLAQGPKVRVLWPSFTDNSTVLKPGTYTITGRVAGTNLQPKAFVTVKAIQSKAPALKLAAFKLEQVSLQPNVDGHESKFIENRDKFLTTLAQTDPNAFLYMFRDAFGQAQPIGAKPLGVWDSKDTKLRGHATGHYLTAIAQAYASTGYDKMLQTIFSQKMEYMVNSLFELSQLSGSEKAPGIPFVSDATAVPFGPGKTAYDSDFSETGLRTDYWNWGKGFISAYPPDQFIMLEKGASYGGKTTQIWAPYYTLHKILAGLIDIYEVSGNTKALAIASGMSDWVYARLSKVPTTQLIKMWNTYIAGEFGGMNESMARLYRITGKNDYLKTAQLFDNIRVFFGDTTHVHGLAKNVDIFRGLHANQHIPQVVGSMEMYRASKNPAYYKVADNFWYKAVNDYMYSIGGVAGARNPANAECFIAQPSSLYENGFSSDGQNETCATYNMLKLTGDLFLFNQQAAYMDYYERGLYNHILASVAKESSANTYHVPLRPGAAKQFGNPHMAGFTCCNGTAIESNTKLQSAIYFKSLDNKALYINLFIPSTLHWQERGITIIQSTNFPNDDETSLTIKGSGKMDVKVRVPGWATKGFFVTINGKPQKLKATPGTYLTIGRNWKNGDVIELKMPFHFYLDPVMDQQNIASLFYGPVLLAAQEPEARKDWRKITLDANDISKTLKSDGQPLQFKIDDVLFKPFYESYGRYSVYLDFTLK